MQRKSSPASGHTESESLLRLMSAIAVEAGHAIVEVRESGLGTRAKADGTLVTLADHAAHRVICARLDAARPDILVASEEDAEPLANLPETFFLIDPLDGTRDFIDGSADFTVNIALIDKGSAVAGVIYAPATGRLFAGSADTSFQALLPPGSSFDAQTRLEPLRTRRAPKGLVALESCSHLDPKTQEITAALGAAERRNVGSSLKLALIAAGEADLYVRAVRLCEWDIAAGAAVLTAAGGVIVDFHGRPLVYGRTQEQMRLEPFVAVGDAALAPKLIATVIETAASVP